MNIPYIRLTNQQLIDSQLTDPRQVVTWMGAMQAQDYPMVKWAIGNRLSNITDRGVEEALRQGKIVRTHVLRPTWHLVAAEDVRWMLQLTAPRIQLAANTYAKHLGIAPSTFVKTDEIIARALEGNRHKTRQELGKIIAQEGIKVDSHHLAQMMLHAELEGIVCSGAPQDKSQTYALIDDWIPRTKTVSKDDALAKLANTYFKSHSPATLHDFAWWSGLSMTDARKGLEMIKTDFVSEVIDCQTYWFDGAACVTTEIIDRVQLLPAFDEYLVSYKDRKAALDTYNHTKVITKNGIFRPVIIHNGQVIGTWKKIVTKGKINVEPTFFDKPNELVQNLFDQAVSIFLNYID